MVDVSSTESLPQLSDVLRALTDSQLLLLTKVRALREEGGSRRGLVPFSPADARQDPDSRNPEPQSVQSVKNGLQATRPAASEAPADSPLTPEVGAEPEITDLSSPTTTTSAEMAPGHDPKDRNYNFFDELDAKLARMDDLSGG